MRELHRPPACCLRPQPNHGRSLIVLLRLPNYSVAKLADMFTVKKLVILSQLAVFKDIIPGYRIRPPSDEEKAMKVTSRGRPAP